MSHGSSQRVCQTSPEESLQNRLAFAFCAHSSLRWLERPARRKGRCAPIHRSAHRRATRRRTKSAAAASRIEAGFLSVLSTPERRRQATGKRERAVQRGELVARCTGRNRPVQVCDDRWGGWWRVDGGGRRGFRLVGLYVVSVEEIADVLGHSPTRMTGDVYRHAVVSAVAAGVRPMEQLFDTD